jgi:radical SAM additional 4Fe4S-binding domain
MQEVLVSEIKHPLHLIQERYPNEYSAIFDYLEFFIAEEFGFWTEEPERFPALKFDMEVPYLISNCTLDINSNSRHNYASIMGQLDQLGCPFLEVRIFDPMGLSFLKSMLESTDGKRIRNVEIFIKYDESLMNLSDILELMHFHQVLGSIVIFGAPEKEHHKQIQQTIDYTTEEITGAECCGNISREYFAINTEIFTEAVRFNSCLNRKISIDVNGQIKNCPSMTESYGSIENNSLYAIAITKPFQKIWSVTKDEIKVCRDCQFRYICTDCRAFVEDVHDKPFKCNYDPYTHTWN